MDLTIVRCVFTGIWGHAQAPGNYWRGFEGSGTDCVRGRLASTRTACSAAFASNQSCTQVESNVQHAAEITDVLSSGSVSGMVNSMALMSGGIPVDEEELMRELESMGEEHEEGAQDLSSNGVAVISFPEITAAPPDVKGNLQQHATMPKALPANAPTPAAVELAAE